MLLILCQISSSLTDDEEDVGEIVENSVKLGPLELANLHEAKRNKFRDSLVALYLEKKPS